MRRYTACVRDLENDSVDKTEERFSSSVSAGRWSILPLVILAAVIVVMYLARQVLIPFAFAIVLSLIWSPPVNWLQKLHLGRLPAVILVVIISLAIAGGIGWVILNQLIAVVNELPDYQQNIHSKIVSLSSSTNGSLSRAAESVQRISKELSTPQTAEPAARVENGKRNLSMRNQPAVPVPVQIVDKPTSNLDYLADLVRQFVGSFALGGIVLIFSVFLLIERQDVRDRLLRLVGLGQLNLMTRALDDATQRVSRYLLLQFAVNAGFGLVIGLSLYFIGLPFAALWGAVAGFLRIVPYVGTLVAGTLPLLLAIAVFNGWMAPLFVFALFAVLELVLGNWIEPRLYGAHTGVSSLAILVTTVFWTILWGPAGLILSMPLTVCVVVLGRYVPQVSFLHILLGDEPALAAEMQVYQRLLALDREEVQGVVEMFLKQHTLLELYDSVLVPALTMAEQDRHKGAVDGVHERFIFLSVKEMIAEFSEYMPVPPPPLTNEPIASPSCCVLCLPASDEADEITAAMLAQLLEGEGIPAIAFPVGIGMHETFALLQPQADDVICVSALPPFAFAQARIQARQLRLKFPGCRLLIGVWGFAGDVKKALDRFEHSRPDGLSVSLTDAVNRLKNHDYSIPTNDVTM